MGVVFKLHEEHRITRW